MNAIKHLKGKCFDLSGGLMIRCIFCWAHHACWQMHRRLPAAEFDGFDWHRLQKDNTAPLQLFSNSTCLLILKLNPVLAVQHDIKTVNYEECQRCASLYGTTWAVFVMWFVGKPVLDLCGHLGKGPEKKVPLRSWLPACVPQIDTAQINVTACKDI